MNKLVGNFVEKFELEKLLIKNVGSWILSLRPQQPTVGSMVLTLNRKCDSLGQLSEGEASDLGTVFQEIETMLAETFRPDKINYLALMMVDNQVHFHVIPRYNSKIKIGEKEFKDEDWPGPPSLKGIRLKPIELNSILNTLKQNLKKV